VSRAAILATLGLILAAVAGIHLVLAVAVAVLGGAAIVGLAVIAEAAIANGPGIVPHPRMVTR
jgi:hypothetical protein